MRTSVVGAARGDQSADQASMRGGVAGRHLYHLPEHACSALAVAFGEHLLAHRDKLCDVLFLLLRRVAIGSDG